MCIDVHRCAFQWDPQHHVTAGFVVDWSAMFTVKKERASLSVFLLQNLQVKWKMIDWKSWRMNLKTRKLMLLLPHYWSKKNFGFVGKKCSRISESHGRWRTNFSSKLSMFGFCSKSCGVFNRNGTFPMMDNNASKSVVLKAKFLWWLFVMPSCKVTTQHSGNLTVRPNSERLEAKAK